MTLSASSLEIDLIKGNLKGYNSNCVESRKPYRYLQPWHDRGKRG